MGSSLLVQVYVCLDCVILSTLPTRARSRALCSVVLDRGKRHSYSYLYTYIRTDL